MVETAEVRDTYIAYKPSIEHDLLLINWWSELADGGDLSKIFHPNIHAPSRFLPYFNPPRAMFFKIEGPRIWFALWAEPFFDGAAIGLWVAPEKRRTRETLRSLLRMVDVLVRQYKTLVVVSKLEGIIEQVGSAAGFEPVGSISRIFSGSDMSVAQLTIEKWQQNRGSLNGS